MIRRFLVFLLLAPACVAFLAPLNTHKREAWTARSSRPSSAVNSLSIAQRSPSRSRLSMELDPSVVGGVVAGLVGLSLGIGAMVFTEQQQERRAERQAAKRATRVPPPPPPSSSSGSASAQTPTNVQDTASDDGW